MTNLKRLLIISFLFIFISGCSDDKNSPTGPVAGEIEIGILSLSQEGILEDTSTEIIIKIEIPSNVQITDSFLTINKLDENNNSIGELGQLYDNGSLDNGDDISGDNIFSGIFSIIETNAGTIRIQASGNSQSEEGLGIGKSEVAELTIYSNITEEEFAQVVNAQDNAADRFEELLGGNIENAAAAVSGTANWLLNQPGVSNIVSQSTTSIEIEFESGLFGAIVFSEVGDDGSLLTRGGISSKAERKKNKSVPL
ncbi:MAG: hypothetical protein R3250_16095, partial [Melioribacteraceae bacterium]|nr:hypothetical protein [Melioribacteraceae bacterium]